MVRRPDAPSGFQPAGIGFVVVPIVGGLVTPWRSGATSPSLPPSRGATMKGMPERLDESTLTARLAELSGWTLVGGAIAKQYRCASFADAIAFVVRIGFLAEAANHHPDLDIRWRNVAVAISTHDAGGLTALDFDLAGRIDEVGP